MSSEEMHKTIDRLVHKKHKLLREQISLRANGKQSEAKSNSVLIKEINDQINALQQEIFLFSSLRTCEVQIVDVRVYVQACSFSPQHTWANVTLRRLWSDKNQERIVFCNDDILYPDVVQRGMDKDSFPRELHRQFVGVHKLKILEFIEQLSSEEMV